MVLPVTSFACKGYALQQYFRLGRTRGLWEFGGRGKLQAAGCRKQKAPSPTSLWFVACRLHPAACLLPPTVSWLPVRELSPTRLGASWQSKYPNRRENSGG